MDIYSKGNDAITVNPPDGVAEALSQHGSDWLWAVTALYIVSFVGLLSVCFTVRESDRVFHYILTMALLVGSVTYFAQASDLGWTAIEQADHLASGVSRQIFFAKYINWAIFFPSYALALGLLSGISWTTIITNIFLSWYWIFTYLAAAYTTTNYKWGFFAFGTFAWLILAMSTLNESRESASLLGITRDYVLLSGILNLLWILYPIAFALSDGSNLIGVTSSFIFFGVLDVLMGPALSVIFVLMTPKWDFKKLNVAFSDHRGDREGILGADKQPTKNANVTSPDA